MGAETLSSRAVIGRFYKELEQNVGASWIGALANKFQSNQDSETYPWIGQVPAMREWIGGRQAKGFTQNGITISNKHWESTLSVSATDLRRDKTGQLDVRIRELATKANAHWASLLSTLIINGESTACYDGQYFFDTDHSEADSGTQSNDISVDISALATAAHGSTTAPSVGEMQQVILQAVQAIYGFKDDRGEPMNENASNFLVMVPVPLMSVALAAVSLPMVDNGNSNLIPSADFRVSVVTNARLTWTDKLAVFRADGNIKPFICQEETPVQMRVLDETSDYFVINDHLLYTIDAWRNVGYGLWQHACLATMT